MPQTKAREIWRVGTQLENPNTGDTGIVNEVEDRNLKVKMIRIAMDLPNARNSAAQFARKDTFQDDGWRRISNPPTTGQFVVQSRLIESDDDWAICRRKGFAAQATATKFMKAMQQQFPRYEFRLVQVSRKR